MMMRRIILVPILDWFDLGAKVGNFFFSIHPAAKWSHGHLVGREACWPHTLRLSFGPVTAVNYKHFLWSVMCLPFSVRKRVLKSYMEQVMLFRTGHVWNRYVVWNRSCCMEQVMLYGQKVFKCPSLFTWWRRCDSVHTHRRGSRESGLL